MWRERDLRGEGNEIDRMSVYVCVWFLAKGCTCAFTVQLHKKTIYFTYTAGARYTYIYKVFTIAMYILVYV